MGATQGLFRLAVHYLFDSKKEEGTRLCKCSLDKKEKIWIVNPAPYQLSLRFHRFFSLFCCSSYEYEWNMNVSLTFLNKRLSAIVAPMWAYGNKMKGVSWPLKVWSHAVFYICFMKRNQSFFGIVLFIEEGECLYFYMPLVCELTVIAKYVVLFAKVLDLKKKLFPCVREITFFFQKYQWMPIVETRKFKHLKMSHSSGVLATSFRVLHC